MAKTSSNLSTILGTGALCATLLMAPIATNLFSTESTHAADGPYWPCQYETPMPESWKNTQFSEENYLDIRNSARSIAGLDDYIQFVDLYNQTRDAEYAINNTLMDEAKAASTDAELRFYDRKGQEYEYFRLKEQITELGDYETNTELQAAVAKADKAETELIDSYKKVVSDLFPLANTDNVIGGNTFRYIFDAYEDQPSFWYRMNIAESPSFRFDAAWDDESKAFAYELVCSATKLDPNFKVNYVLSTDPFGSTGGDVTPPTGDNTSTDNKPNTTIESNDKNVKVSGINININYTLNVDKVAEDLLKLAGDDFKNSTNQAFYDIYIRDSQDNIITNTGKVQVSIKLPSNMSVNSDFVVYYIPMAQNGEYLTDQAQAIKGVKVSADGWLTFETDHFSVYGIVEYPKGKAPNSGVVAKSDNSSVTTAGVKIAAGVVSVLTAAGATIVARRQMLRKKASNKN